MNSRYIWCHLDTNSSSLKMIPLKLPLPLNLHPAMYTIGYFGACFLIIVNLVHNILIEFTLGVRQYHIYLMKCYHLHIWNVAVDRMPFKQSVSLDSNHCIINGLSSIPLYLHCRNCTNHEQNEDLVIRAFTLKRHSIHQSHRQLS